MTLENVLSSSKEQNRGIMNVIQSTLVIHGLFISRLIFVTTIRSLKHYTDKGVLRRISEDSLCYAFTDHPGKFPVASQKWRDFYEFSLASGLVPKQE